MLFREHRRRPKGLADLLTWGALVAPGVCLNKDGSLLAGFSYRGPDVDSATEAGLKSLARHLNQAFLPLGGDWMLHVDAVRGDAAGGGEMCRAMHSDNVAMRDAEVRCVA